MGFIERNPHPKKRKQGDCVVRALSLLEERPWLDVYDELCAIGREEQCMPNEQRAYEAYLTRRGYVKQPMPRNPDGTKWPVHELMRANPEMVAIVSVPRHITCIKRGELLDTWDCGRKYCGNYYTKTL